MSIERRKNAAAYHVSRSAVKNVQVAKRGTDTIRDTNPYVADSFGSLRQISPTRMIKKTISCGFMVE